MPVAKARPLLAPKTDCADDVRAWRLEQAGRAVPTFPADCPCSTDPLHDPDFLPGSPS